jgi:hypothetical protein
LLARVLLLLLLLTTLPPFLASVSVGKQWLLSCED